MHIVPAMLSSHLGDSGAWHCTRSHNIAQHILALLLEWNVTQHQFGLKLRMAIGPHHVDMYMVAGTIT